MAYLGSTGQREASNGRTVMLETSASTHKLMLQKLNLGKSNHNSRTECRRVVGGLCGRQ